jgi:hypothetical protein
VSQLIRTTLRPFEEITVSDAEYANLLRQGLVYGAAAPAPPDPDDVEMATILDDETSQTYARLLAQLGTAAQAPGNPFSTALGAALGRSVRVFYIDAYGADPTGVADSAAAYNAALAAMPTATISGTTLPVGTLVFGAGKYRLTATTNNVGPFVNVIGQGRNATTINYTGSGDAIRMSNPVRPVSDTFDQLAAWHGKIDGFTIDGTGAGQFASGIHYGDTEGGVLGPDLMIQNFTGTLAKPTGLTLGASASSGGTFAAGTYFWVVTAQGPNRGETQVSNEVTTAVAVNGTQALSWTASAGATSYNLYRGTTAGKETVLVASGIPGTSYTDTGAGLTGQTIPLINDAGAIGLHLDNAASWTESLYGRVLIYNCTNCVVFNGTGGTNGDASFEYNDLTFKVYLFRNQNGVIIRGGALYENGSLKIRANATRDSLGPMSSALLCISGYGAAGHDTGAGVYSKITVTRLDIQAELNKVGANAPRTIVQRDPAGNPISGTQGIWAFAGAEWVPSNNTGAHFSVKHTGIVLGDPVLNPANTRDPVVLGNFNRSKGFVPPSTGVVATQEGDFQPLVLTQNTAITFGQPNAGARELYISITQPNSGGPYTVTWPSNASPTTASPNVRWAGGTAPQVAQVPGASELYRLVTLDGATFYGSVVQTDRPAPASNNALAVGVSTMLRSDVFSNNTVLGSSGSMRLTYFTPEKSVVASNVRVITGTTAAAATPTLCRIGLFSVAANGDLTLIGSTPNDTTLFAAASTAYSKALSASATLLAGQRYAMGILVVSGVGVPSFQGQVPVLLASEGAMAPALASVLSGQTDLPSSVAVGSLSFATNQRFYGVFS